MPISSQSAMPSVTSARLMCSLAVELRRLARGGLGLGVLLTFTFLGLSAPVLALYMPEILGASTNTDQLTIAASQATPASAVSLFNQSAMQLGLIVTVAVSITSLGWDTRPGSSIFYRTRVPRPSTVMLPRLAVDWLAALGSYSWGLLLAIAVTTAAIGHPPAETVVRTWVTCGLYIVMAMSIGYVLAASLRRTVAAVAVTTILVLVLPVMNQVPLFSHWTPTALLLPTGPMKGPMVAASVIIALCAVGGILIAGRQELRRDA